MLIQSKVMPAILCVLLVSVLVTAPFAANYDKHKDIKYSEQDGKKSKYTILDIYTPKADSVYPVVLFVHGGAWITGDKKIGENIAELFTDSGYVFVSINYRMSPNVTHPIYVEDLTDAIVWTYSNTGEYSGDPKRIALLGHSSGANMVALVSTDERLLQTRGLGTSAIKGTVLLECAGYDIPRLKKEYPIFFGLVYKGPFGEDNTTLVDASPYSFITPGKSIPPMLIIHVDREQSRKQSGYIFDKLDSNGYDVTKVYITGRTHTNIIKKLGSMTDTALPEILTFLDRVLDETDVDSSVENDVNEEIIEMSDDVNP